MHLIMHLLFYVYPDYNKTFQKEVMLRKCYFGQVLLGDSVNTTDFEKVLFIWVLFI